MPAPSLDVFAYLDYRAFLRDHYLERKAKGRSFSYRAFSRRAGLRSPNYLKLVIDGDRNLTVSMASSFAKACGLEGDRISYFQDLVAFNHAKTVAERDAAYARLTGFRRYRAIHRLELRHGAYHATWYLPAIRELASRSDFRADARWIARTLVPAITAAQATRALKTLHELGLLVRDKAGRVKPGEAALVSTGAEAQDLHIAKYHLSMLERAGESMDLFGSAERDISSLTLCLGADGLARVKQRIQRFRRELLELSELEDDPEQVVQINFQAFPLSRRRDQEAAP